MYGTDGNPPADVSWYKDNTQIVTGKEKAILVLSNVDKDDSETYRCEAKSGIEEAKSETSMDLIVSGNDTSVGMLEQKINAL